jgi:hypothetical protein
MPTPIPISRPRLTRTALIKRLADHTLANEIDPDKELIIVGIRGYYKKTMGDPTKNDRGIYDDALFILSPKGCVAFNGNTDPAEYRPGFGSDDKTKGIASLAPGVWRVYKFADHKPADRKRSPYPAICQRAGKVTVWRDSEDGAYEDTGNFGINIHKGGINRVSSVGCQTVPPDQWDEFYDQAMKLAKSIHGESNWKTAVYPYVLIE